MLILYFQMLMSVPLMLITVTLMLTVPTLWGASPVPVTLDTVGMAPTVQVRKILIMPLKICVILHCYNRH